MAVLGVHPRLASGASTFPTSPKELRALWEEQDS